MATGTWFQASTVPQLSMRSSSASARFSHTSTELFVHRLAYGLTWMFYSILSKHLFVFTTVPRWLNNCNLNTVQVYTSRNLLLGTQSAQPLSPSKGSAACARSRRVPPGVTTNQALCYSVCIDHSTFLYETLCGFMVFCVQTIFNLCIFGWRLWQMCFFWWWNMGACFFKAETVVCVFW